jgi:hypothetical protein
MGYDGIAGQRQDRETESVNKTNILFSTPQTAGAARVAPENRSKHHEKKEKRVFPPKRRTKNLP